MVKATKNNDPVGELIDEIEYLLAQYAMHRRHKMAFKLKTLKAIVTAPLEITENLIKLRWKSLIDLPFTIAEAHIEFLDAEHRAPGRELSYLLRASEAFRDAREDSKDHKSSVSVAVSCPI